MAKYPKAFEEYYLNLTKTIPNELDDKIFRIRKDMEISLANAERVYRKMLFAEWAIKNKINGWV